MFGPMSFTTTMFDELILELGELATLRDEALRHPEIAASPALKEAVPSLAEAVTAIATGVGFGVAGILDSDENAVQGAATVDRVIFACVHSAGRSQMAAAFFNRLADPEKARAVSAGTEPADRVHPEVVEAMREAGYDLSGARPSLLPRGLAAAPTSLLVTMGCGEACPYVPGLRREDWALDDPKGRDKDEVRRIRDEIRARVERLVAANGWARPSS